VVVQEKKEVVRNGDIESNVVKKTYSWRKWVGKVKVTPRPQVSSSRDMSYRDLEQANEIAWEHIPAFLSAILVEKLATPPPIFWSSRDSNDVPSLEIKLFLDGGGVIIQGFHCR
jgi:hypothetical protein